VEVVVDEAVVGRGVGASRRRAETAAAAVALRTLAAAAGPIGDR
jgi:dsRNA-specific ribonuclease